MSHTCFWFLYPRSRSLSGQRSKWCLSNNSKTIEANLTKLHRKIEHYEKVCCAQELGSYTQGQGQNHVRMKLHRNIEQNEKVCSAQELGSYTQGQGHNQVKGQIVPKIVLLVNY